MDKVFCFCYKLFNLVLSTTKLVNESSKDWKNINHKLRNHEISNEQIANMIFLETMLLKNEIIDEHVQEQINRDREHWRNVLFIIIVIVKTLAKNNLAFRVTDERICKESNGNF